jgi:hypothetical protein
MNAGGEKECPPLTIELKNREEQEALWNLLTPSLRALTEIEVERVMRPGRLPKNQKEFIQEVTTVRGVVTQLAGNLGYDKWLTSHEKISLGLTNLMTENDIAGVAHELVHSPVKDQARQILLFG